MHFTEALCSAITIGNFMYVDSVSFSPVIFVVVTEGTNEDSKELSWDSIDVLVTVTVPGIKGGGSTIDCTFCLADSP